MEDVKFMNHQAVKWQTLWNFQLIRVYNSFLTNPVDRLSIHPLQCAHELQFQSVFCVYEFLEMITCQLNIKLVAMRENFIKNYMRSSISRPRMNMIWCRTEPKMRNKIEKFLPGRTEWMWFLYGHWLGSCNKFSLYGHT